MNRILKLRGIALIASLVTLPVFADERDDRRAEMRERWESMSEEERDAARAERGGGKFRDLSDEERQAMKERWDSMSDEERQAMREKHGGKRGGRRGMDG